MGEVTRFPWENLPANPVERTVELMQKDMAYMVTHTAVLVHSNRPELRIVVNTPRGQIIPKGAVEFKDGSTVEFQDIGMCQPGCEEMNVGDLLGRVWSTANALGLEFKK